jgi:FAD:protein FMN transferase
MVRAAGTRVNRDGFPWYTTPMIRRRRMTAGLAAAVLFLALGAGAWGSPRERTVNNLLGTTCTIRLYAGGTTAALDAAFARIAQIEARMTLNRDDSEVVRVNASAGVRAVAVTPDVLEVISQGLKYSALGDGAFDISVGPLVTLWGIGTSRARVPGPEEIRRAVSLIGYRDVAIDAGASTVFLKRRGMALDLGSIAKGYAADEAARVLRASGVSAALIDLGGNILTFGAKPDRSPWRIGIQNPVEARGTKIGIVEIASGSVTTAGTYERYFEQGGKRYFHILDARTGYPAWDGLAALAVIAPDSSTADGYDTMLFTLGLERGRALVESTHGAIEAVFVTEARQVYVTPGLRARFTLSDPRFTMRGQPPIPPSSGTSSGGGSR